MPTLAPKLPWTHAFAGGYPRLGGQLLPSDPDAIDYLERVKAADGGVAVEVGVAMAVDAFVKGCKADSAGYAGDPTRTVWDALQSACIMCGARTISGALVPLVGTAPTGYGDWASGDYDRSSGLKGNGSTKYLDSNRANDADGQDDNHNAVYVTAVPTASTYRIFISSGPDGVQGVNTMYLDYTSGNSLTTSNRYKTSRSALAGEGVTAGFKGVSRPDAAYFQVRSSGSTTQTDTPSTTPTSDSVHVFDRGPTPPHFPTDARFAFYSIGSALDLAALDNRVTQLVTGIKFHSLTGLVATDYDPDTVAYIVAAYEAGGTL